MSISITITPLRDLILIRLLPQDMTEGGIAIPKSSRRRTRLGSWEVMAVGPGIWNQGGFEEPRVKRGDKVMLEPAFAAEFQSRTDCFINETRALAGETWALCKNEGICAIIEGEDARVLISDIESTAGYVE